MEEKNFHIFRTNSESSIKCLEKMGLRIFLKIIKIGFHLLYEKHVFAKKDRRIKLTHVSLLELILNVWCNLINVIAIFTTFYAFSVIFHFKNY